MCACDLGCACVGWGRGIGRIDFRASPNANRPDSCARMQAAHREKQNPQSRKPRRLTRRILSNGSTANARDRMRQVSLGWPRFPASAHDPTSSASPPPARLDALLPHKARAAHRFASLCFPPRPRGRAVPAPAQRPVGRGLGVASCTGSSDRPHPVRVWPALQQRSSCAARGVHRSIVSSATSSPARSRCSA